ncbi:MAG: hypothetical protein PWQ28_278 [Candidatus Woesearchaeota archaeon]|nr:hypothetical protein [Candidatus Woesearchaeota archaeon]
MTLEDVIAKTKRHFKSGLVAAVAGITLLNGCTSSPPSPPPANEKPVISVENQRVDEGKSGNFNINVSDDGDILNVEVSIEGYNTKVSGEEPNYIVEYSPKNPNDNGQKELKVEALDDDGNYATKSAVFEVIDTPDVEFYNMPDSVSLKKGETKEVTGHIRDDYTSLEDLVLNASCENADVNIEKIGGDEFNIVINANTDHLGESEIIVNAADDEGNSSSYSLPINIIPLETRTLDVHLDFDGVNVTDNNDDDVIDDWYEVNDIGNVFVSAYKVPVTSYDEYTVSTEFPELDSIYLNVDRDARECIMEEQEFSDSSEINFSLTYEDQTLEDFIIEIDVRDKDQSHHNYSFLVDPQMEEVDKYIKVGQNDKILNILLGYGVANHENSGEQPLAQSPVGIQYSTGAWPEGSPEEIWLINKEGYNLTPEASEAIRNSCEYFFPEVPIEIKDNYETPIPDNIFIIEKTDDQAGAFMTFWRKNHYEYGTNYVRIGGVYLRYDSTEAVNEEIGTVAETAAEPQGTGANSIFSGNEDVPPGDKAVFAIKDSQEPKVGLSVIYSPDPGQHPWPETKASWVANATISADGRTVYVLPKREEF